MKIHPINPSKLTLLEAGQFINRHLTGIRALGGPEFFTDSALNNYLEKLDACQGALSSALMIVRKSNETIKIQEQDEKRDQALSFLYRGAAFYEISEIEEERNAAISLNNLFATYKNLATLNYEAESLGIDNLISDLRNSKYEPEVALLDLERCVSRLEESNEAFKTLFAGRIEEVIHQETFDAKTLKKDMPAVYNDFASYVLARAKVEVTPALFTNTLAVLNATRKYYSDLLARRKGVAAEAV